MSPKSIRFALLLSLSVSVIFVFSQLNAQAQALTGKTRSPVVPRGVGPGNNVPSAATAVIYSQPPNPSGGLYQSSWDINGSNFDQYIWDNFTLQSTQVITEVQWRGGYGSGGLTLDFTVEIYESIAGGSQPDVSNPPKISYPVSGNAGETLVGTFGGTTMYDYAFTFPVPFTATVRSTYWVQIEASQSAVPDWGIATGTGGEGKHFQKYYADPAYRYRFLSGDAAFTLLGPTVPIINLSATNNSPTVLSKATAFTATVDSGSGITYTWDFGDQTTGSGQIVTRTYAAIGNYTAVVTATNAISSATATTYVTITDVPIAGLTATNDSPTVFGNVTSLTATIASGGNAGYQWNFGDGTLGTGRTLTHTYGTVGAYTAIVTASNSLNTITATTPVTIFSTIPLANAGADQTVMEESAVTLDGSSSFALPGHWPLTYHWQQIGGTAVLLSNLTISRPTFIAPAAPAVLTFTLIVTDSISLMSDPDQVKVSVIPKYHVYLPLIVKSG